MYGNRLHIAIENEGFTGAIMDSLKAKGFSIEDERAIVPSLEDVFIATVKRQEDA
jgi:hypothetical protein